MLDSPPPSSSALHRHTEEKDTLLHLSVSLSLSVFMFFLLFCICRNWLLLTCCRGRCPASTPGRSGCWSSRGRHSPPCPTSGTHQTRPAWSTGTWSAPGSSHPTKKGRFIFPACFIPTFINAARCALQGCTGKQYTINFKGKLKVWQF